MVGQVLKHLNREIRKSVKCILLNKGLIAQSLNGLQPSELPINHVVEHTYNNPIYRKTCRMSPNHSTISSKDVGNMLAAGTIKPSSSSWFFSVFTSTGKDGNPRL